MQKYKALKRKDNYFPGTTSALKDLAVLDSDFQSQIYKCFTNLWLMEVNKVDDTFPGRKEPRETLSFASLIWDALDVSVLKIGN